MDKFTKGKWEVKYYHRPHQECGEQTNPDIMCNGERIATVCLWAAPNGSTEIAEANARLIAAAPTLLRACELTCVVCFRKKADNCKTCKVGKAIESTKPAGSDIDPEYEAMKADLA